MPTGAPRSVAVKVEHALTRGVRVIHIEVSHGVAGE
jgi:hypothetical protein